MTWLFSRAMMDYVNLPCSQEREAESSEDTCSGGEQYAPLNVMPTPHKFWRNDKMMDALRLSRFGLTSKSLTEIHGEAVLTSFLAGFPVRTLAQPAKAQGLMGSVPDSGLSSLVSLGKYDPDSCTWKTAQLSLLGGWDEFSETWPRWGTMRSGECWEQMTLVRRTEENEYGLWPKITVCGNHNRKGASKTSADGLATAVRIWATPRCFMHKDSTVDRGKSNLGEQVGGPLNPNWIEWLMGWPVGWTDLKPLATDKFREWQQQHSIY